ncbi:harpin HrpZ family protein [Vibrio tritonius]|uniref:Harpin HrpZ family protein n=1 Tax=Vibrio tritonius TaxID=1435069 RepID=A0ABS7YMM1_9VIBR|nr:harpin HrpZ family protein [Vibrio tritonius]MCA2016943.1 harpin HrpZ family protein [Vibrio tritonius]
MINATLTISISSSQGFGQMGALNSGGGRSPVMNFGSSGSSIADTMADLLIDMLFKKNDNGATFDDSGDNPIMDMVASFMDKQSEKYGGPNGDFGGKDHWKKELKEDNGLNADEFNQFKQGIKDALNSIMDGTYASIMTGGSANSNGFGGSLGGFKQNDFGSSGFGAAGFGSSSNIGGGQQCCNGQGAATESGFSMGGDFAAHVGHTAIDGLNIIERHGRFKFGREDKDLAKEIGKFMDQHPETYGEPPRGGWANRIEKRKDFNSEEIGHFKDAMQDIKDLMDGKSMGNSQLDSDGMMLCNAIMSDALYKVSQ